MNHIRQSLAGRCLNFIAMMAFLVVQVPGAAFAATTAGQPEPGATTTLGENFRSFLDKLTRSGTSGNEGGQSVQVGTKVTHEALKFFVPEKRIRLDASVFDPKGVTVVRAYFKSKTQADYVFVPMEAQQTAKDNYVANLPAMSKSNDEVQYLFLVVNGANEVLKTEPFVVKVKDSTDVPSWQMVSDDGSVKLFTEVPDAPAVAASFSDSVSLNVVESGARFGLVAQIYTGTGSATVSGAAAGATNAGTASVAAAGVSTMTIALAAAGLVGVASSGGGSGGGGSSNATPTPTPTPTPPVVLTSTSIVGVFGISGGKPGSSTMSGSWTFSNNGTFSNSLVEVINASGQSFPFQGTGSWSLNGTSLSLTDSFGGSFGGTATGSSNTFTLVRADGYVLNFSR